jgi:hypothetical protein
MKSLIIILAFFSASAFAQQQDGNELLKDLKAKMETSADAFQKGIVRGYIIGVIDSSLEICRPENVTNGQIYDVVQIYLEQNPAIRHEHRSLLVWKALFRAFPCKLETTPKTKSSV